MKFSLYNLKQHLNSQASLEQIGDALTNLGLEVESIEQKDHLKNLIIAQIIEASPHPNADKLQLLKVDTGNEILQIVCGAKNARLGLKGVLAPIGTYLPALDLTIKKSKIRSIESYGMMCSYSELGFKDNSDGIIELPEDAPIGQNFLACYNLQHPLIEIAITPNRSDCCYIHGIARDLAAYGIGSLVSPKINNCANDANGALPFEINLSAPHQAFDNLIIRQIKISNNITNHNLKHFALNSGLESSNYINDLSIYIALNYGIPIFAIDRDKIQHHLTFKYSEKEENITTQEKKSYIIPQGSLMLFDQNCIVAVPGIVVDKAYQCDKDSKNILLFAANFCKESVSQTRRLMKINNYASYRYERGIDPFFISKAMDIFSEQVKEDKDAAILANYTARQNNKSEQKIIFPIETFERYSSIALSSNEITSLLQKNYCEVTKIDENNLEVTVPSFRPNLKLPVDLISEILRLYNLQNLPSRELPSTKQNNPEANLATFRFNAKYKLSNKIKNILAVNGFCETINWSFISHRLAVNFGGGQQDLILQNPITNNKTDMRPSLLPGLIEAAQNNARLGYKNLALCEIGDIYQGSNSDNQILYAATLRQGHAQFAKEARNWRESSNKVDIFDAKRDILSLLDMLKIKSEHITIAPSAPNYYHPGKSGTISYNEVIIGYFGELHPDIEELMDIKENICCCEINLEKILELQNKATKHKFEFFSHQIIYRDLAFILDNDIPADILQKIALASSKLVKQVKIFDIFTGGNIAKDKKSVAIEIAIHSTENLDSEAIDKICSKVTDNIIKETNATLRCA